MEEKFLTTTYTVCTVIAGLKSASKLAIAVGQHDDALKWDKTANNIKINLHKLYHPDGYFRKGLLVDSDGNITYDDVVDISSLYGAFMYSGLEIDNEMILGTAKHVEERLLNSSPSGGVIRYENDQYFLRKLNTKVTRGLLRHYGLPSTLFIPTKKIKHRHYLIGQCQNN
jgi:GH15 family glucan-1,4-alpha-glucosidase